MTVRLPSPCLVVLAGPAGSGKSTWAAAHFPADAFALLEEIVTRRTARGLTTVIDTTGLDARRRDGWRELARTHGIACVAVGFDTPAATCRARNRARRHPVPAPALTASSAPGR